MDAVITYDISTVTAEGQKRLALVAAICERYGTRVQYSVFECRLSKAGLQQLIVELRDTINLTEDSIHIYRFEKPIPESRLTIGRERSFELGQPLIFAPRHPGDP